MSLATSRARLQGALKELNIRWGEVRLKWNDPVSQDFEKRYVATLEPRVRNTLGAMEKMDAMLAQARRDCG